MILIIILLYVFFENDSNNEKFTPFNVLTDYKNIKGLNELTKKVLLIFHKNNFTYWTCGGTLLGMIRDL